MLKILVLICASSLDRAACTQETALDVILGMSVPTAQQCAFMGQAMIAPTALKPDADDGKQYVKIMCVPVAAK